MRASHSLVDGRAAWRAVAKELSCMEQDFKRDIDSLDGLFAFVDRFADANGLDEAISFPMRLAAEELFTNFVRHNRGGRAYIAVSLDIEDKRLFIRLRDFDVDAADFEQETPPDVHLPLEERRPGGLGIYLVKSMFDSLTYDYTNRTLSVTAVKNLEDTHV
jgi:serine/threonine-protein kinase RsbW